MMEHWSLILKATKRKQNIEHYGLTWMRIGWCCWCQIASRLYCAAAAGAFGVSLATWGYCCGCCVTTNPSPFINWWTPRWGCSGTTLSWTALARPIAATASMCRAFIGGWRFVLMPTAGIWCGNSEAFSGKPDGTIGGATLLSFLNRNGICVRVCAGNMPEAFKGSGSCTNLWAPPGTPRTWLIICTCWMTKW